MAPFAQSSTTRRPCERRAEPLADELDVALGRGRVSSRLAPAGDGRASASSSASTASSSASSSFQPPRKNLTPLYSAGLCDAETTAPPSSASSATAGVGRTPPRTTSEPPPSQAGRERRLERRAGGARVAADEHLRARRSSARTRGPAARRARRSGPRRRRRGRHPSRTAAGPTSASPGGAPPEEAPLPLRELRRLAGLVEPGLLALDDARVARQEALALETPRSSGSASTSARAMPWRSAPAWPEAPPPWIRARMSKRPSTPATRSGAVAVVRSASRGKYVLERAAVDPRRPVARAQDHARDGGLALAGSPGTARCSRHQSSGSGCGFWASCGCVGPA